MTGKKIYLIRHGQTDYNFKGIVQGSGVNSSLNETGRLQAQAFYDKYKEVTFDKIYTSALKRTVETVQPFLDDGYPHEAMEELNEIHWGNKEGLEVGEEENTNYHRVIAAWRNGNLGKKMDNGESPEDVALRLKVAMDKILSEDDEKRVLVCMHGRAMRILLCMLLNYPIRCMDYFPHHNTCLYKLCYTGSLTSISSFNNIRHLEQMAQEGYR